MTRKGKTIRTHVAMMLALAVASIVCTHAASAAVTTTVDTLADPGGPGVCSLRDAIEAAERFRKVNGCTPGDTIIFSVSGTIKLTERLFLSPRNDLTITGPVGGITLDAQGRDQVMFADESAISITLQNLTLVNGFTRNAKGGGGIFSAGPLDVTNCTFIGNSVGKFPNEAGGRGAGIRSLGALNVSLSNFLGNKAHNGGGAIFIDRGNNTIDQSTFSDNSAGNEGGAIAIDVPNKATVQITNSAFLDNSAKQGGAINDYNSPLTIVNSTFAGGTGDGGAIYVVHGLSTFGNDTFAGNSSATGTIVNDRFNRQTVTIANSILAENRGGNCFLRIANGGNNISDDATCEFGNGTGANGQPIGDNVDDPGLDPAGPQSNGGPTKTIALLPDTVGINAVPAASCPATDQRGFDRPGNPDSEVPACDIGAFELGADPTP
jgi:fibronectin-binding autotransporter adhesin